METINLICIGCPLGCPITVEKNGDEIVSVTGNTCKNGDKYARKEVTNPTRIVTSSVPVSGGTERMVSCKTASDVPKGRIFAVMEALKPVRASAPVHIGDVLLSDAAGTGVNIVATRNVEHA